MSELSRPFPRLQIAQLEGRGQSTRYKQIQFQRLHQALTTSAPAIKLAIQADSGHTTNEVELEFTLALSELRVLYDSLDLPKELDTLRKVTVGQDNLERTKPAGIVYIVPAKWCLFHAIISPLGAALAAGNCVILEVGGLCQRVVLSTITDIVLLATSNYRSRLLAVEEAVDRSLGCRLLCHFHLSTCHR